MHETAVARSSEKLWSIQALRFAAALMVVELHASGLMLNLHHANDFARLLGDVGKSGVDIFFVISGFIIARTSQRLSAPQFLLKRAIRVLPLYFLLAAPIALAAAFRDGLHWRVFLADWFLWPATDRLTWPLVPVAWTLCFEALFYWAFALMLWRRSAIVGLAVLYTAGLAFGARTPLLEFIASPMALEFLFGVALAYAPRWRPAVAALPTGAVLLIAGLILGLPPGGSGTEFLAGDGAWLRVINIGVPAALVVWGTLQLDIREGLLTRLGDASYALYLIHVPILGVVETLVPLNASHPDLVIILAMTCSCFVAVIVHERLEKPLIAWLRAHTGDAVPKRSASTARGALGASRPLP